MTDFDDEPTDAPAGDHPDRRSPDVERPGSDRAERDADRDVEGRHDLEEDEAATGDGSDPGSESPGETIDDPVVAEPNEPA